MFAKDVKLEALARFHLGNTLFRQGMRTVQLEHGNSNLDAAGFMDAFYRAISENIVDSLSRWAEALREIWSNSSSEVASNVAE